MVYKVFSLIMVFLVVLGGCATSPGTSPPPAAEIKEVKTEAEKPKAEQPTAAAPAKPTAEQAKPAAKPVVPSGTLTSAVASFGEDTLVPMLSGASNHAALIGTMYEGLVRTDGEGKLHPQLAESWSVSPDGKTWTFKLRKGIKFHNGDEMTSADVKFSLERVVSPQGRTAMSPILRTTMDRVDAPDPYTVTITTKDVTAILVSMLGTVVEPKKYIEEKGEDYFARNPVGTGPWRFVKHEPGQSVELEAVKDHWQITPAFERLIIKLIPEESTRMAMLKRGEVDVIEISLDRVDEVKAAGFRFQSNPNQNHPTIYFAGTYLGTDLPTQDLKVRQALSMAINREEMAKEFFKGFGEPAVRVKMGKYSFGYDPSWKAEPYDPQKAKQLLAEAGYPGKFKDPTINLWSYQAAGAPWMPQVMQIVSGYWEAIGVKTKLTAIEFATMRSMYIVKPVDPKIVGTAYSFNEPAQFDALTSVYNAYGSKGILSMLQDQEWDALYTKTLQELDTNKRVELTRQLMNRGYNSYAALPLVNVKTLYAVGNRVGEWPDIATSLSANYVGMPHK